MLTERDREEREKTFHTKNEEYLFFRDIYKF